MGSNPVEEFLGYRGSRILSFLLFLDNLSFISMEKTWDDIFYYLSCYGSDKNSRMIRNLINNLFEFNIKNLYNNILNSEILKIISKENQLNQIISQSMRKEAKSYLEIGDILFEKNLFIDASSFYIEAITSYLASYTGYNSAIRESLLLIGERFPHYKEALTNIANTIDDSLCFPRSMCLVSWNDELTVNTLRNVTHELLNKEIDRDFVINNLTKIERAALSRIASHILSIKDPMVIIDYHEISSKTIGEKNIALYNNRNPKLKLIMEGFEGLKIPIFQEHRKTSEASLESIWINKWKQNINAAMKLLYTKSVTKLINDSLKSLRKIFSYKSTICLKKLGSNDICIYLHKPDSDSRCIALTGDLMIRVENYWKEITMNYYSIAEKEEMENLLEKIGLKIMADIYPL